MTYRSVWHSSEYAKLKTYDADTALQPVGIFMCHDARDGQTMCRGWLDVHRKEELLALRLAITFRQLSPEIMQLPPSGVPVFASGAEAAAHGNRELRHPGAAAVRVITKLVEQKGLGSVQPQEDEDVDDDDDITQLSTAAAASLSSMQASGNSEVNGVADILLTIAQNGGDSLSDEHLTCCAENVILAAATFIADVRPAAESPNDVVRLANGRTIHSGWIDKDDPDAMDAGDYLRVDSPTGEQLFYMETANLLGQDITYLRTRFLAFVQACNS